MPAGAKTPPGPLSQAVAGILRAQKGKLDLTDEAIGDASAMSRSQISGVLNAKKHVDIEQLDAICYAMGLNLTNVIRQAERESEGRRLDKSWKARPVGSLDLIAGQ